MRCSSCIGGRRRSHKRRNDHESASPVKLGKTADSKPGQRMDQHPHVPACSAYRVESPPDNQWDNDSATFNRTDDYRPPSITITELDDETDEENDVETHDTSTSTIRNYEDTVNLELVNHYPRPSVQSSRAALEIIREEEFTSDCSDSETTHILPKNEGEIPPSRGDGNTSKVDKTSSGHGNGVGHVTPKFGSINVLRDFLRYRQQRQRRRGTALHNAGPPHFQQNEQQVPTTCLLVDAKESSMAPTEYRSICTTEIVSSEVLQAEVINIGSNSSSLDDLSDMESENREGSVENVPQESSSTASSIHVEFCNNDPVSQQQPVCDRSKVTPVRLPDLHQTNEDVEQSTGESNCNLDGDSTQNRPITKNQCLQPNILNACEDSEAPAHRLPPNQTSDSGPVDDIAKGCALTGDVGAEHRERHDVVASSIHNVLHAPVEKMSEHRTTLESSGERDPIVGSTPEHSSASLLVEDRDRASAVVGNDENVINALKDPWSSVIVRDCVPKFDIDCTVNHCVRFGKTPPLVEEIMHRGDQSHGGAIAVKSENQTFSPPPPPPILAGSAIPLPPPPAKEDANVTNLGQNTVELPEVDKSDTPPPPAQLVPLTVEALSTSTAGSSNGSARNAQAHGGDHPSKTDHADANQNSTQNCVDAVTSAKRPEPSNSTVDDQSALLKYIQVHSRTTESSEKHYQGNAKNSPNVSPDSTDYGDRWVGDLRRHQPAVPVRCDASTGEDNVDCAAKIEQAREDHGGQNCAVSSEAIVLPPNLRNTDHEIVVSGTKAGMNNVSRAKHPTSRTAEQKIPSNTVPSVNPAADTSLPDRKQALATDLRTEISRLKDAELEDEFRKLELEAARYERELQQITVPRQASSQSNTTIECTRNYYVSKQNDFVIQRSSMSSVNNSNVVGVMHGGRDNQQLDEGVGIRDQRKLQRSNHDDTQDMVINSHGPGPVPPPPVPSIPAVNPAADDEEFVVKKVKDRVRDLMASQAAAEATKNAMKIRSAPSTPTAGRKNIEAEFKEFRELRQREAIAERKQLDTKPAVTVSSGPAAKQPHPHTVRNFSPSRIPLATSKASSVSHRKLTDTIGTEGKKGNQENKAPTEESDSEKIQVNVAALIATHQEKQQLSTLPAVAQVPKIAPTSSIVELHAVPDGKTPAQNDPASAELVVVSVSDKCQQFEQRIRKNSTDSACDTITYARKICNNSPALGERQPFQQKPGTTYGRNGDVCCDAVDNNNFSEIDLLHEIDHALVLAKDFLFTREHCCE
uniref:Uncharacterized protein n=1 Tax=Anopheles minimus TaxID=112268 RepID=A0A182WIZ6_9DIPT